MSATISGVQAKESFRYRSVRAALAREAGPAQERHVVARLPEAHLLHVAREAPEGVGRLVEGRVRDRIPGRVRQRPGRGVPREDPAVVEHPPVRGPLRPRGVQPALEARGRSPRTITVRPVRRLLGVVVVIGLVDLALVGARDRDVRLAERGDRLHGGRPRGIALPEGGDHDRVLEEEGCRAQEQAEDQERGHQAVEADARPEDGGELAPGVELAEGERHGEEEGDRQRVRHALGRVQQRDAADLDERHLVREVAPDAAEHVDELHEQDEEQDRHDEDRNERGQEHAVEPSHLRPPGRTTATTRPEPKTTASGSHMAAAGGTFRRTPKVRPATSMPQ